MVQTNQTDLAREKWRLAELLHGRTSEWVPKLFRGFAEPRHLWPISDVLDRASRDGHVRALLSAAPRHGKSTLLSTAAVRHLVLRPGSWVMFASHSAELADVRSREIRDAAVRAGLALRKDSSRLTRWETTNGGGLVVTSVGASNATGQGASLLLADDLYGGREQAESSSVRDSVDSWWTGTFATRATVDGSIILSGTRWHLDDQHARLAERDARYETVNLSAISEDGAALWPEAWPLEALEAKRSELGPYDFSSLYQGNPVPRGESLFVEPRTFTDDELQAAIKLGARIVLALDPAAGIRERNDYSAAVVMALLGAGDKTQGYVLHAWRGRMELPQLVPHVVDIAREHGASLALVEGVGGFRGYADAIRSLAGRSLRVHVPVLRGDKWVRANPLAAAIADGRVRIPDSRPSWTRWLIDELLAFPSGVHDDGCDALSLGFNLHALAAPGRTREELAAIRARIERAFPFGV